MPSTLPSSFASAAAGNTSDSNSRRSSGRGDGVGHGDWSSRRPNGATQTFRRPSLATNPSNHTQQRESLSNINNPSANSGAYVPPHISASRNSALPDARYSKDQLLDLFREQRDVGDLDDNISDLYMGDWDVDASTAADQSRWSKRDDNSIDTASGPEICLSRATLVEPLGLTELTADEREHFLSSVNSPLKAPNQAGSQREGGTGRKLSFSQSLASPTSTRPSGRRRDTSESFPFPKDSTANAFTGKSGRDDSNAAPPSALLRRRTDLKDAAIGRVPESHENEEDNISSGGPFGLPRRVSTGPLSAGPSGPQSPWSVGANAAATGGAGGAGAFGGFGVLNGGALAQQKRPVAGLSRGESRFKGLMSFDSNDDTIPSTRARPGQNAEDSDMSQHDDPSVRPFEGENTHFTGEGMPVGSAALGGAHDESPPPALRPGNIQQQSFQGGVGHDNRDLPSFEQRVRTQAHSHQAIGAQTGDEPLSPTFTNPYHSPERGMSRPQEHDSDDVDLNSLHLPGLGGFRSGGGAAGPQSNLNARVHSGFDPRPFDRSSGFGGGPTRGFPSLGGLGALPNLGSPGQWPASLGSGTPSRERLYDSFAEGPAGPDASQAPGLGGLRGTSMYGGGFGQQDPGNMLRGGRLGSLFPTAMQEQMRGRPSEGAASEDSADTFASRAHGQGFPAGGVPLRDTESPFRSGRSTFDDYGHGTDKSSEPSQHYSPSQTSHRLHAIGSQTSLSQHQQSADQGQQPATSGSGQPPAAQQKTMVMPDRIRWIYRDPQGNTQGPWSGLEMHDWYRAGFFSPELLVKKAEDADYEPLAQLIRRIGNSREPFLVPQIGIPGPPSTQSAASWPAPTATAPSVPSTAAAAQPPFANSFPSFGTTLTAEQQNALERRKQEEQYLMARQKEHLAQQQVLAKQMQMQTPSGSQKQSLQHHSSAHSLQSQPSYGSITSPNGFPSAATAGPMPSQAAIENGFRGGPGISAIGSNVDNLGNITEEEPSARQFEQMNLGRQGQHGFEGSQRQQYAGHDERTAAMLADRARLQQEQNEAGRFEQEGHDAAGDQERLREFEQYQQEAGHENVEKVRELVDRHAREHRDGVHDDRQSFSQFQEQAQTETRPQKGEPRNLTLTEQVQKAASAKHSPTSATQSPWGKIDKPLAESHPASQTSSPLPAPAARRSGGQSVADHLAAESSSQRASPLPETPSASVAPWAKEPTEGQKQPSLKEIQEAEARRAAKQEEMHAAMRRAALEKELASQPVAPAPGLPSSSTWANADSAASPSATPSAWAKSAPTKAGSTPTSTKKTLQQIQKEEEALARKQKAAAAAASNASVAGAVASAAQALSSGKRYADLASKAAQPTPGSASAWTTVGAGGKPKTPGVPSVAPTLGRTSTGTTTAGATSATAAAARPKPTTTPSRTASSNVALTAQDEFRRWAVNELHSDLKKGLKADEFVGDLLSLPSDTNMITEVVYAASETIDSRHFAEEFVRRRALADKGKPQPSSSTPTSSSQPASDSKAGGWNEVARKGPMAPAKEDNSAFKIVAAKKKGAKR